MYKILMRCGWCKADMGEKEIPVDPGEFNVSHGMCPPCAKKIRREYAEMRLKKNLTPAPPVV